MEIIKVESAPWRAEGGFDPLTFIASDGTKYIRSVSTGLLYNAITLERMPVKCRPKAHGDQEVCGACGLEWAKDHPDEPPCPYHQQPEPDIPVWASAAILVSLVGFLIGWAIGG